MKHILTHSLSIFSVSEDDNIVTFLSVWSCDDQNIWSVAEENIYNEPNNNNNIMWEEIILDWDYGNYFVSLHKEAGVWNMLLGSPWSCVDGCIIISLVIRVTTSGQGLLTCAGWSPLPRTRHQPFNFRKIKSTNIYNTLQATASPLDTHCLQRHRKHVQVSSRNCFYWRIQVYVLLFMIKNPCCQGRCLCSAKYLSSINTGSFVLTILHLTIIIMNYSERARLLLLAFHITVTTASGLVLTTPPTESCRKVNPFS